MTAKLITLAGLLLILSNPVFAASPEPAVQAPGSPEAAQDSQTAQQSEETQKLAWQRVGAPLSLES